ncbi:MAG TPA: YeeE/YedE thiosulfate transporter family protein [Beijerinckiaceae bacterium]|jgi:uncharacterized membrane protein YedE/YeeE
MSAISFPEAQPRAAAGVAWTPYLVGAGIGVLSWIVFAVVAAPLGITTALSQVSGAAATPVLGADAVAANAYWAKNPFRLDYGVLFLVGVTLGGFLSAATSGGWRLEHVPDVWAQRFGPSVARRYVAAFFGGLIAMYGARLANGCTSGNGISGGLQLAVSGWTFLAVMFPVGVAAAFLIYGPRVR